MFQTENGNYLVTLHRRAIQILLYGQNEYIFRCSIRCFASSLNIALFPCVRQFLTIHLGQLCLNSLLVISIYEVVEPMWDKLVVYPDHLKAAKDSTDLHAA